MSREAVADALTSAHSRWGRLAIVGVSVAAISAYVVTALLRIGYPYELSYFEGSTVEVAARVAEGLPLYGPPSMEWTPWPYPPLYFWISGYASNVLGVGLPTLRLVSFVASLAALALIALIVSRVTRNPLAGLVSAALFAGTYRVSGAWLDSARVDSLFLALVLAGGYLALRARGWRSGVLVGGVFVLAFLTKQNALIVAVPVVAWLLIQRRPAGIAAAAVLVGGAVSTVLVGDLLTDGWYSPYIVSQLLGHGSVLAWLVGFWFVDLLLPFAIVTGALAWWAVRQRAWPARTAALDGLAALVAGLWLAGLAGRLHEGGYANVAIPAHAGMALVLGVAAALFLSHPTTTQPRLLVASAVLLLQLAVMSAWRLDVVPQSIDRKAGDAFVSRLAQLPTGVLIPSHPHYLRLAGLPTHASAIAVGDLLATRSSRAKDALLALGPWPLDSVNTVILDHPDDATALGPAFRRDFRLVSASLIPGDLFTPVTDVPTRPVLLYVRIRPVTP